MLKGEGLWFRYGSQLPWVVRDRTLAVLPGEVVGVMAPSGYGKTTLELSGGELQRVAIARVLNRNTRYLIADEMTAMLDANTQALIWQVILAFARQYQVGVIAISHDKPLLERICHGVEETEAYAGSSRLAVDHRILNLACDPDNASKINAVHT